MLAHVRQVVCNATQLNWYRTMHVSQWIMILAIIVAIHKLILLMTHHSGDHCWVSSIWQKKHYSQQGIDHFTSDMHLYALKAWTKFKHTSTTDLSSLAQDSHGLCDFMWMWDTDDVLLSAHVFFVQIGEKLIFTTEYHPYIVIKEHWQIYRF